MSGSKSDGAAEQSGGPATRSPAGGLKPSGDAAGAGAADAGKSEKGDDTAKAARKPFHVKGPGAISFGGKTLGAGTALNLTDDEAEELDGLVAPGKAPPTAVAIARRGAGIYQVAGPGAVQHGGRFHEPPALLELTEAEAKDLGTSVREVT